MIKNCVKCGKEKEYDNFYIDKRSSNIHPISICKECKLMENRDWYKRNRFKRIKQIYEYLKLHPSILEKAKKKYQKSEKGKVYFKEWQRKFRLNYPEIVKGYEKKRNQTDKRRQQMRIKNYTRRALKKEGGSFTVEEFYQKLVECNFRCHYCKIELTPENISRDHLIPLSKGGINIISNIVPCCMSCNSRKGIKEYNNFIKNADIVATAT